MRALGYKFTTNLLTLGPELLRGPYKLLVVERLCGFSHVMQMMPASSRGFSTYLSRVELSPPMHLATSSISDVYREMQKIMYVHSKYSHRPHVLIHVELPDEELAVDTQNGKLYLTHQFLGLGLAYFKSCT